MHACLHFCPHPQCQVEGCELCDGDVRLCQSCGQNYTDGYGMQLYPSPDNSSCVPCETEQCTACEGAGGACTECAEGWGVVDGACKKCEVEGCVNCDDDPSTCKVRAGCLGAGGDVAAWG